MKKLTLIFCTALIIAALTGCNSGETNSDNSDNNSAQISDNSGNSQSSNNSENSDNIPEKKIPDGEPTFLTAPDGTPIYTSEISEVYKGSEEWGNKETITFEQAEQAARAGDSDFTVKCDGFAYGYIPEKALNHVDDPEMFKQDEKYGEYFKYLGEGFDVNTGEGIYSTEYMRITAGDKFGSLTVKNAYTLFVDKYMAWHGNDFSDIPGVYISDCCVEFDGEIEMTGYVSVTKMETLYGSGGDMTFFPDGDSSVKLPGFFFFTNPQTGEICHFSDWHSYGFFGSGYYSIGNMFDVDCDTSGLHPGDSFVKVKLVLDNVKYVPGSFGGYRFDLKSIDVI